MANKPEFVDLVSDATRQHWRRRPSQQLGRQPTKRVMAETEVKEEKRLSHWPPARMEQWRLIKLTPWKIKLKSWQFKDWV